MANMSSRERANEVREQSRAYLASLRASRRDAAKIRAPAGESVAGSEASRPHPDSRPSRPVVPPNLASARVAEAKARPVQIQRRSASETDSLRREITKARHASAAEMNRLLDVRRESKQPTRGSPSVERTSVAKSSASRPASFPTGYTETGAPPRDLAAKAPGAPARQAPPPRPPAARSGAATKETRAPIDIDAISGLGSALKSKLRRLGLGTVDKLAEQRPDQLRKSLGPVGRLVNIESLLKSAAKVKV